MGARKESTHILYTLSSLNPIHPMRHILSPIMLDEAIYLLHAITKSHVLRRDIGIADNRIQGVEVQGFESVFPTSYRRFRGIALMPMLVGKQIADFRDLGIPIFLHRDTALTYHFAGISFQNSP